MKNIETTLKGTYDVVVVGGGIAGVAASVSAAREGMTVLLIEKGVNLGGLATSGLISWYEPLCDGLGNQTTYGIAEELIKLCCKYNFENLPVKWGGDGHNKSNNERYATYYSPTVFTLALDEYVLENGVKLCFDALATYPVMEGNLCTGVIVETVSGREQFNAKFVIDATGTACIMDRAGVPTVVGENYMTYVVHWFDTEGAEKLVEDKNICKFRRWMNAGSDMMGKGHPENMGMLSGVSSKDVTDYMIAGKARLLDRLRNKDKNSFDVMTLPNMPQFRKIRRIVGKTDFNAVDGEKYEDSIGNCSDFRPNGIGKHYQIPGTSLFNENFGNLIAAGRIISAPDLDGWEVARVIPNCALTGEAAGRMAALCIKENKELNQLNKDDFSKIKIN